MPNQKSCVDCIHSHQWSYADIREEPGDSGWECKHPVMSETIEWCEFIDDTEAGKTAESCSYYEQIDYAAVAKAEAEMETQLAESERLAKEYWEALE
jgi:hypothetical protein